MQFGAVFFNRGVARTPFIRLVITSRSDQHSSAYDIPTRARWKSSFAPSTHRPRSVETAAGSASSDENSCSGFNRPPAVQLQQLFSSVAHRVAFRQLREQHHHLLSHQQLCAPMQRRGPSCKASGTALFRSDGSKLPSHRSCQLSTLIILTVLRNSAAFLIGTRPRSPRSATACNCTLICDIISQYHC